MKIITDLRVTGLSEENVEFSFRNEDYEGIDKILLDIDETDQRFKSLKIGDKVTIGIQFGEDDEKETTEPTSKKVGKKV